MGKKPGLETAGCIRVRLLNLNVTNKYGLKVENGGLAGNTGPNGGGIRTRMAYKVGVLVDSNAAALSLGVGGPRS